MASIGTGRYMYHIEMLYRRHIFTVRLGGPRTPYKLVWPYLGSVALVANHCKGLIFLLEEKHTRCHGDKKDSET